MAISTITFYGVNFTAFIFLCYVTSFAQVSGDSDATNHSLFCNGRWCVQNEEYCDKSQNKCSVCQYTQQNCTPHLDCLTYCIGKGIEHAMQDRQDTIPEENSPSAWALPLFILFLVLFIVSFGGNVVFAVCFLRQRHAMNPIGKGLPIDTVPADDHEKIPFTQVMKDNDATEDIEVMTDNDNTEDIEVMTDNDDTEVKEVMTDNDDTEVKKRYKGVQEQGSKSNEKQYFENLS